MLQKLKESQSHFGSEICVAQWKYENIYTTDPARTAM